MARPSRSTLIRPARLEDAEMRRHRVVRHFAKPGDFTRRQSSWVHGDEVAKAPSRVIWASEPNTSTAWLSSICAGTCERRFAARTEEGRAIRHPFQPENWAFQ